MGTAVGRRGRRLRAADGDGRALRLPPRRALLPVVVTPPAVGLRRPAAADGVVRVGRSPVARRHAGDAADPARAGVRGLVRAGGRHRPGDGWWAAGAAARRVGHGGVGVRARHGAPAEHVDVRRAGLGRDPVAAGAAAARRRPAAVGRDRPGRRRRAAQQGQRADPRRLRGRGAGPRPPRTTPARDTVVPGRHRARGRGVDAVPAVAGRARLAASWPSSPTCTATTAGWGRAWRSCRCSWCSSTCSCRRSGSPGWCGCSATRRRAAGGRSACWRSCSRRSSSRPVASPTTPPASTRPCTPPVPSRWSRRARAARAACGCTGRWASSPSPGRSSLPSPCRCCR